MRSTNTAAICAGLIDAVLAEARRSTLQRFRQFGRAYLLWAMTNPTHSEIIERPSFRP